MISRRDFISSSTAIVFARNARASALSLKQAPCRTNPPASGVTISRIWKGDFCESRLDNRSSQTVSIAEVVLFDIRHDLPPETSLYGESFQMLSQTAGTLAQPLDLGYSETKHYKIPQPTGVTAITGLLTLAPPSGARMLFAFTSCRRFIGRFYLEPGRIQVIIDTEGLELPPGQSWALEEFTFTTGSNRDEMLDRLAHRINVNHPPIKPPAPPTGWCSWYCFGPRVTAKNVTDNLDSIATNIPSLKYIQLDDGYQPAMGDWLETGNAFGGDVLGVLKQIRERGFEPAIWVAPFIAEENSLLFQNHPGWFVKASDGRPLKSSDVTFGGWRKGPWYALDGTHPEAQRHLESVFHTMRRDWGCTYFKLDANFWGAIHGGRFHDSRATRIDAYRRGMHAIRKGAGDSFILGCNHPIWPSFGLIHGSRSSGDIKRSWATIKTTARQNLNRNWQDGRLWWNDPDAVVLSGGLPANEYQFHATAIYACGGMILSGDDLTQIPSDRLSILRKLLPPTGRPAAFEDEKLRIGVVKLPDREMICLFNWTDSPEDFSIQVKTKSRLKDVWSGEELGTHQHVFAINNLPAHSARLIELRPA